MFLFTLDTQVATLFLTANFLSGLGCCFVIFKQLKIFGMFMFDIFSCRTKSGAALGTTFGLLLLLLL